MQAGELPVTAVIAHSPELALTLALIVLWLGVAAGFIAWVFTEAPRDPVVPSSDEHLLDLAETLPEVVRHD